MPFVRTPRGYEIPDRSEKAVIPAHLLAVMLAVDADITSTRATLSAEMKSVADKAMGSDSFTTEMRAEYRAYVDALASKLSDLYVTRAEAGLIKPTDLSSLSSPLGAVVNVKEPPFGAVGDGVADDTAAINLALASGAGRSVYFPAGVYKVTSSLYIYGSGTEVVMGQGVSIRGGSFNVFSVEGSAGEEIPLAQAVTTGAKTIVTSRAHGLVAGDYVQVKSQRDAMHADAGDEWCMGYPTSQSSTAYFGEWAQVGSVISETEFTLRVGLVFPDYLPDNRAETSAHARAYATVQKVTPAENVTIRGGEIRSVGASAVWSNWAKNLRVEGITHRCASNGYAVSFTSSWDCVAHDCKAYYPHTAASQLYSRNAFKSVSSQMCGFEKCHIENGSQNFDFTYQPGGTITAFGFVRGCTVSGASSNPMTSHGGSYAISVEGNVFVGVEQGISIRSRSSIVTDNVIVGTSRANSYGVYLYEGWARDCVVSGNSIVGFTHGVSVIDAPNAGEQFGWIGGSISGNSVAKCSIGVNLSRAGANSYSDKCGLMITGNTFRLNGSSSVGVSVGSRVNGVAISGNGFSLCGTGVKLAEDVGGTVIAGNVFSDSARWVEAAGRVSPAAASPVIRVDSSNVISGAAALSGGAFFADGLFGKAVSAPSVGDGASAGEIVSALKVLGIFV